MKSYPYIIDPAEHPWAANLQDNWQIIKKEYEDFCSYVKETSGGNKITRTIELDSSGQFIFKSEVIHESIIVKSINGTEIDFSCNDIIDRGTVLTKSNKSMIVEKKQTIITIKDSSFFNKNLIVSFAYNPLINFVEKIYDGVWIPFSIYRFGMPNTEVAAHFTQTLDLLKSVPGLETAMYSLIEPGTHIKPHRGYSTNVLRCHVGLTPKQDAYLRVGEVKLTWDEGSLFIFDDTEEHEVLHSGTSTRVSFIIDFKRDPNSDSNYPDFLKRRIEDIKINKTLYKR